VGRFCRLDELHSSGLLPRSCCSGGGIGGGIGFCRRLGLAKVKLAVTVGINRVTIRVILAHTIREILIVRDRHVGDPAYMTLDSQALLDDSAELDRMAALIDPIRALPWPQPASAGDSRDTQSTRSGAMRRSAIAV
jgi:gamma-glutamyltranspeptidase